MEDNHHSDRYELKYLLSDGEVVLTESALQNLISKDSYCLNGEDYTVRSLYFDDYTDSAVSSNEAGLPYKAKFRIRYYNNEFTHLNLELKKKSLNRVNKLSCPLTLDEYQAIISGDVSNLIWSSDKPLLKKFCIIKQTRLLTPKVITTYQRTAFVLPFHNIRITFDKHLIASNDILHFLDATYSSIPFNFNVLEVKFNSFLPKYLKMFFSARYLLQSTFSKYYHSRLKIGEQL